MKLEEPDDDGFVEFQKSTDSPDVTPLPDQHEKQILSDAGEEFYGEEDYESDDMKFAQQEEVDGI